MAFSTAGLPEGVIREMLTGIVADELAFADEVCRRVTGRAAMTGRIPIRGTAGGVGRGENQALAPLSEAKAYDYEVSFAPYTAAAYVGYGLLSDEEKNDSTYFFDEDAINLEMQTARRDANTALDRSLSSALSSVTLNDALNVTANGGAWDSGTSTPAANLREAREELAPHSDTIIIGRAAANALMDTDDFLATPIAGNAYDGGVGNQPLLELWLKQYLRFKNVYIFDRLALSSGVNQANVIEHLFDDGVWVGYQDDLILVHPDNDEQDSLEIERVVRKRAYEIQHTRYDDIIRPSLIKGVTLTNVLT